jgi:hypothetical protein
MDLLILALSCGRTEVRPSTCIAPTFRREQRRNAPLSRGHFLVPVPLHPDIAPSEESACTAATSTNSDFTPPVELAIPAGGHTQERTLTFGATSALAPNTKYYAGITCTGNPTDPNAVSKGREFRLVHSIPRGRLAETSNSEITASHTSAQPINNSRGYDRLRDVISSLNRLSRQYDRLLGI